MAGISTSCCSAARPGSTPATRSRAGDGPLRAGLRLAHRPFVVDAACVGMAFALGLGLFWMRQWQIAGTPGLSSFPLDDSWIHLQFARNLAEGRGFVYNTGTPVAGSTAPLWTLTLAAVFALLGVHLFRAKVSGIGATLATALL